MNKALAEEIRRRANFRCEYCQTSQRRRRFRFVIDHIVARQHGGPTAPDNLALCCDHCNLHKGPNISGVDPESGAFTRLFNPRSDIWSDHFQWNGPIAVGTSDIGRTTIIVLAMNDILQVTDRARLIGEGLFPE